MRIYFLILSFFISVASVAQTPNYIYGRDVIITTRDTSSAELTIKNTTRNVLGYFKNIGGGKGRYTLIPQIDITGLPDSLLARYTKTQSDARYKPIGYFPSWAEITGIPANFTTTYALSNDVRDSIQSRLNNYSNQSFGGTKTFTGAFNATSQLNFFGTNGNDGYLYLRGFNNSTTRFISQTGLSTVYNGLLISSNPENSNTLARWDIDLGGNDAANFANSDGFELRRRRTSASPFVSMMRIDSVGAVTAKSFARVGGTSTQYQMGDGSVDTVAKQAAFYINVEDYGAVGDGTTDDTDEILAAIAAAKAKNWGLAGTAGKTYVFSPIVESDITGIPFFRNLTLNMNGVIGDRTKVTSNSIEAVFKITGTKALIDSNVVIRKDRRQMTIDAGLAIGTGDVLFITSLQAWVQPVFSSYYRGQRVVVNNYDTATGLVTIFGSFNENISSAYVWKNTYSPKFEVIQSQFYTKNNNELICFYARFADIQVDNSVFKNFGYATLALNSSEAQINGTRIYNPNKNGNGLSYGVAVWDLSKVFINNAHIEGGRHAIMGGGGRTWFESEMGGVNSSDGAVFPGEYFVNGGYYSTDSIQGTGAIDAHANMWLVSVKNTISNDGLFLGAVNNIVENVQIDAKNLYGITIPYANDSSSTTIIDNAFINAKSFAAPLFSTLQKMKYLSISDLNIVGNLTANVQPINIADSIGTILINGLNINVTNSATQTNYAVLRTWNDVIWRGINVIGVSTQIIPRRVGLNISVLNSSFRNSPWSYGLFMDGTSFKPATVTYDNCAFVGNTLAGNLTNTVGRLIVRNSFARDNGTNTGASNNLRSGVFAASADYVNFSGNDTKPQAAVPTQTYGLVQSAGTSYKLINNDFSGNTLSPGYVVSGTAENIIANKGDAAISNQLDAPLSIPSTGTAISIGSTNTATTINFAGSRGLIYYDAANMVVQGGTGKGVWLNYNGANTGFRMDPNNGNIGLSTAPDAAIRLLVGGSIRSTTTTTASQFRLSALNTAPASASDTGTLGEIRIDANFIYVCTATNTWKRVAISTW